MKDVEVPVAQTPSRREVEAVGAAADSAPSGRGGALDALHAVASALQELPGPDQLSAAARFSLLAHLDDDARRACDDGIGQASGGDGAPLVRLARAVFGALLDDYHRSLAALEASADEPEAPDALRECRVRLVRAGAQRVKWERCAGGPAHPQLWLWLGAVFEYACGGDPAGSTPAPAAMSPAVIEREYMRAVAYYGAGLEHLQPALVGAVDRLIDFVLPMLLLQGGPSQGAAYCVSPGLGFAPRRTLRVPEIDTGSSLRLVTRVALGALHELAVQLERGMAPARLDLAVLDRGALIAAVHHLLRNWSETPPVRRYRRHVLGGKLTAVRGIEDLRQLFTGESVSQLAEWAFHDASRGGIGAVVQAGAAPLALGELVGILPHDGETWQLGVVRRVWRESDSATRVGLEALSLRPVLASADDGLVRTDVLLCDPLSRGEAVRIAAPANTLRPGVPVFLTANGSIQKLKPLDAALSGEGFELRVYQVL